MNQPEITREWLAEQLAELERIVNATASWDECEQQSAGPAMWFTPEAKGKRAAVFYGDGDPCATVYGNLGLGYDATPYAELFAFAANHSRALLAVLRKLMEAMPASGTPLIRCRYCDQFGPTSPCKECSK